MRFVLLSLLCAFPVYANEPHAGSVDPSKVLGDLKAGNKRYASNKPRHTHQAKARRVEVAKGQHPGAAVVSCSDSRVPPEVVFDQGLGDLFVVRSAGHVVDDVALGSLEYAVEHLGVGVIVVMGHERCGAVDATLKGGELPGHLPSLVKAIAPGIKDAPATGEDALDNAVRANVTAVTKQLMSAGPALAEFVKSGKLKVVGARYDLDTGAVEFLASDS